MSNIVKEYQERRRKYILSEGESFREANVYCPHCAAEQTNDEGQFSMDRDYDRWIDSECDSCEKTFQSSWEAVFSTRKKP